MQRLGKYVDLQEVGRGASATVYRGLHPELKVYRALKVFHDQSRQLQRRRREAVLQARVDHPGIVRVLDFEHQGELSWLVMEYAPLGTLRRHLEDGPLPPAEALHLAAQMARALAAAHSQGVHHLDLKPENVLFFAPDQVKIADFGLARLERQPHSLAGMGTPHYMAPEQMDARPCAASDLWALGAVIFEMLTGELCFPGRDLVQVRRAMDQAPRGVRRRLAGRAGEVEEEVAGLVESLLRPDPARRRHDAAALAAELEDLARRARSSRPPLRHTQELPGRCPGCGAPVAPEGGLCPACRLEEDGPRLEVALTGPEDQPPSLLTPSPRPWWPRRWLAPLAGLVLAAAVAVAVGSGPKTVPEPSPAPHPEPTPTTFEAPSPPPPRAAAPIPTTTPPPPTTTTAPPPQAQPWAAARPAQPAAPAPAATPGPTAGAGDEGAGDGGPAEEQVPEMVRAQRELLQRNPDHVGAHRNLALWHLQRGEYEKARRHLEGILRRNPHDLEARNTLDLLQRLQAGSRGKGHP